MKNEKSIAIVGAGAIGCRIAALFAQKDIATTLFDGWHAHVEALRRDGLVLELPNGERSTCAVEAFDYDTTAQLARFDIVLLAVRSDDTARVLPLVQRLLKDDGCVVSVQNGVNEDAIAEAVGAHRTLGCSLVFGAKLLGPAHVLELPGADVLRTGELVGGKSARLDEIVALFGACGTSTPTYNLVGYRWMKLMLNATGNTLLLLSGLTAQQLHAREDARRVIIRLAREVLGTAVALGIEPEPVLDVPTAVWTAPDAESSEQLHRALQAHGDGLGARRLSMVADFEARGRTEVDHINGYVVRKARQAGRAVPLNEKVVAMVKEMEARSRRPGAEAIAELEAVPAAS
ncbi:putative 2-dehydropantoate 2-reductase [Burkholderiales bacterium 8X]|nr:putative 2-dehydropantoate 2-reductase [Burkholderiales bacterium 8X]